MIALFLLKSIMRRSPFPQLPREVREKQGEVSDTNALKEE